MIKFDVNNNTQTEIFFKVIEDLKKMGISSTQITVPTKHWHVNLRCAYNNLVFYVANIEDEWLLQYPFDNPTETHRQKMTSREFTSEEALLHNLKEVWRD